MTKSPNRNDPESSRSSTSSDQDVDQPTDYVAVGRSYECVFCKRGFTTAQALGGHMNIHRKDRAKNNRPVVGPVPTSLIHSNNHHSHINYHTSPINKIYNLPISGYVPQPYNYYSHDAAAHAYNNYSYVSAAHHEPRHDNYRTYFPASTSDGCSRIPQFGDDWRVSLSLPFGGLAGGEGEEEKGGDEDDDDEELDLELRLGYNP